jgi:uncharacterized protein (TIGR03435 family)
MRKFVVSALLAASALAQNAAPPAFEVASVKINRQFRQEDPSTWRTTLEALGDGLTIRNLTMRRVVAWAYNIQWPQVAGPSWIDTERYDILAKAGKPATEDEMRPMLQTLLADRFNLRFHRETRQVEVMALVVPKGGHKMTPSTKEKTEVRQDPVRGSVVEGALVSELAENMAHDSNSIPVVDMTGLKGRFDFTFNVQKYRDSMRSRAMTEPRINEAEMRLALMQDLISGELGLKIESRKAPIDFLVIDRADQKPTDN